MIIKKIDKHLDKLTKTKSEKTHISKIRGERDDITKGSNKTQGIIRTYLKNLNPNKLENLKVVDEFLDVYETLKLRQGRMIKQIIEIPL